MVFTYWRHLTHREVRLLAFMANQAKDTDTPPVYWAGWEAAAEALDLDVNKPSTKRTTMSVIAALGRAGALVPAGNARQGAQAEYAMTLDPAWTWKPSGGKGRSVLWTRSSRTGEGVRDTHPQGVRDTHPEGVQSIVARVCTTHTPRNSYLTPQENEQDNPTQAVNSLGAVDNSEQAKNEIYQAALAHLLRDPINQQHYMDKAAEQLPPDAGCHAQVTLAASLAGWKRDAA